jgi:hypothetical protein
LLQWKEGAAAGTATRTAGRAGFAMNLVLLVSLLMGGFLANVGDCQSNVLGATGSLDVEPTCVPSWIRWIHYLSPLYYAFAALVTNEVSTLSLDLKVRDLPPLLGVRGNFFLGILGVEPEKLTRNVAVLSGMYFGFAALAMCAAWWRLPARGGRRR